MKKLIFFLFVFAIWVKMPRAQTNFRFGFQVSPSFSWMDSDDKKINSNGNNLGLKLGARGEFFFAERYAIVSGLGFYFNTGGTMLYETGGVFWPKSDLSSEDYRVLPAEVDLKYSIRYVEVPLSLKLLTPDIGRDLKVFVEIPAFFIGFRSQARGDISKAGNLDTNDEDIRKDVIPLSLSWGAGAGGEYILRGSSGGDTNILFGVFYQQGFTDVTTNKAIKYVDDGQGGIKEEAEDSKAIIRAITIHLGVMF